MRAFKTLLQETNGAEIAETAAVLPVLFMVVLAIFLFGRAYNIYGTITQAAMQGARAAVVTDCATCTNTAPTAAQIATNYVGPTLKASHLDVNAVTPGSPAACLCGTGGGGCTAVSCDNAGTGATPSICVQQNVALTPTVSATQSCGTVVSFQYPYNFELPYERFTLNLKASAQMQTENQQ